MSGGADQATKPVVEDDAGLSSLVEGMSPIVLALSAVHMSGALDIIRMVKAKPPAFNGDMTGQLTTQEAAAVRARVVEVITAWRDAGQPPPYRPTSAELHEMVEFAVGMPLSEAFSSMVLEDMGYERADMRAFEWDRPVAQETKAQYPVLVIGAGMSGLVMGLRLKQAGLPFVIVEKNQGAGGTWYENRYPGLRVDVPSHAYSFSFLQDHRWSHLFSKQADLLAYFTACVERFGLADHIRYGLEVVEARWDEGEDRWSVEVEGANGRRETLHARAVVSAVGFLNRPSTPSIEGAETFRGEQFHTARWPDGVALKDKRVVIIGSAATAIQAIPPLAEIAGHLTVFQRSPGWTRVSGEYSREIRDAEQWAIEHLHYYAGWMRAVVFNWSIDFRPELMKVDPQWPQDGRAVSAMNAFVRQRVEAQLHDALGDRPDLLKTMTPDYPIFVKRPTVSDGNFFAALRRPNVEVVSDGVARITEQGVVDGVGSLHEADVIIYATGFQVQKFLTPMVIKGRGGLELNAFWQDRPGGYLGIQMPRFPNFFMMYGPGTNLGYNGNLIFNSELQARYIASCLRLMVEEGRTTLEVRDEVFEDYMERTGEKLLEFVWSTTYGSTYFRNDKGRVTTNSPWSLLEMWTWTRKADPAHFVDFAPAPAMLVAGDDPDILDTLMTQPSA